MEQHSGVSNYMLNMLGLSSADTSNSKLTTSTSGSNSASTNSAASLQMQTLLAMSALGSTDPTVASALNTIFTGVPLNALLRSTSTSANLKSLSNLFGSNGDDALNLSKRKTGNVSASLSLNSATNKSSSSKVNTTKNSTSSTTTESKNNFSNNSSGNNLNSLGQMSITELLTASKWPAGKNFLFDIII